MNAGFAVVWVSCRGTFGSEGTFIPLSDDQADGFDTLEWITARSWSNGRVGMYGPSYTGGTQWAAASTGHPALQAIAPMMCSLDWYKAPIYHPGGAYSPTLGVGWAVMMSSANEARALQNGEGDMQRLLELGNALVSGIRVAEYTPLLAQPQLRETSWWTDMVRHSSRDGYWQSKDMTPAVPQMTQPALFITGWYDLFCPQQLVDFATYRAHSGSEDARNGSRLIVGPWDHFDITMSAQFPDRDFGLAGCGPMIDITGEHLRHFKHWLCDDVEASSSESRVKIFVMGEDQWREAPDWPVPGTVFTDFFLDGGKLTLEQPSEARNLAYYYDPKNPVHSCAPGRDRLSAAYEPKDCAGDRERNDVLTFETETLTAPVEVIGHVSARLFVASDAVDTDFTVRLLDVFPDGRAIRLCDGLVRMRYRDDLATPKLIEPDRTYEVTVQVGATANVFRPGHRIRVDVSSSNFPRFDRNTNTGRDIATESIEDGVVARNTLFTGPEQASRVVLPLAMTSDNS
jgi:putative CocE/NonD family hydrolase